MKSNISEVVNPYEWCKDYLYQKELNTPYTTFLAMYGLYRNAAFLFYANAIAILILYQFTATSGIFAAIFVLFAIILGNRCRIFYNLIAKAIYQHFLVAIETKSNKTIDKK